MEDLCKILKGHENEIFYCSMCGECKIAIDENAEKGSPITVSTDTFTINLDKFGRLLNNGECLLFPSKEQRDWNKWLEDNIKTPKTWDELVRQKKVKNFGVSISLFCDKIAKDMSNTYHNSDIERSALALLKIYQLIESCYGGNVTTKEWEDENINIYYILKADTNFFNGDTIYWINNSCSAYYDHFAFHTKEQAKEFLSYPENIQLLNDFYMIS